MKILLYVFTAVLLASCLNSITETTIQKASFISFNNLTIKPSPLVKGTKYADAKVTEQAAYVKFTKSLDAIQAITILAEVDHAKNAKSVGMDLPFSKIVFFGNPKLGTPLMQKNQLAGIDLPQKVLFYDDGTNNMYAMYNSIEYLKTRHGLDGVETLPTISKALSKLVGDATKSEVMSADDLTVDMGEGVETVTSRQTFDETYNTLHKTLSNNPNISIMLELDHKANAASVNLELRPTKVIVFGNPKIGTILMQDSKTTALDLPLKMLVWQGEDGKVMVSYNNPYFIADRHDLNNSDEQLSMMENALRKIANKAAGLQ